MNTIVLQFVQSFVELSLNNESVRKKIRLCLCDFAFKIYQADAQSCYHFSIESRLSISKKKYNNND